MLSSLLLSLMSQCSCPCPDAGVIPDTGAIEQLDAGFVVDAGTQPTGSLGCGKLPPSSVNGSFTVNLVVNGVSRSVLVDILPSYNKDVPGSLTIGFHGQSWNGVGLKNAEPYVEARAIATSENGIFVFPSAVGGTWNLATNGSDVLLFDAITSYVKSNFCIDQTKQYIYGRSYGAAFSRTLMIARQTELRAVGMVIPYLPNWDANTAPISLFLSATTRDPTVGVTNARNLRDRQAFINGCIPQNPTPPAVYNQSITTTYKCTLKSLIYNESDIGLQHNPFPGLGIPMWNSFISAQ